MLEMNKQEASNISNSSIQQAKGDINNYGVSYSDVKDICRDVIRQEFQIVTQEAVEKLNKIIEEFQTRLIEKKFSYLKQPQADQAWVRHVFTVITQAFIDAGYVAPTS